MVKLVSSLLCLVGAAELASAQFSTLSSTLSSLGSRYTTSGSTLGSTSGTRYTTTTLGTPTTSYTTSTLSSPSYSFTSSSTPSYTTVSSPSTSYSYSTGTTIPSYTTSSGLTSYTPTEYVDPRTRTYPKVDSYLKKKDIFDQEVLRSYNLEISPQDFARMKMDPSKEEYYPCTFTVDYGEITEQSFPGAGCRYKGSVGSLRMCLDPNSRREDGTCRKLSLKVDTNKFNTESQKVAGLRKFNFHGMAVDHSLLAERSVYNMFQVAGVASPRAVNAKIYINGQYDGVYGNVEAPDEEFTKRHFKDDFNKGKGALYKEAWIENRGIEWFTKHRENGKDEDAFMMEVVRAVEAADVNSADYVLEKYFDTESFVNVTAINTLVGATDDWRIRHNFWWYVREDENGKKLVMIPWDYDRINDERADSRGPAPGRAWHDTIPKYNSKCTLREKSAMERARAEGHRGKQLQFWAEVNELLPPNVEIPVQCDQITHLLSAALKDDVDRRVLEFADVTSSSEMIDGNLNKWYQQLAPAIAQDRTGDPPTQWTFRNEVQTMRNWLNQRKAKAVREAQGGYGSYYNSPVASYFGGGGLGGLSSLSGFQTGGFSTLSTSSFGANPFGASRTSFG